MQINPENKGDAPTGAISQLVYTARRVTVRSFSEWESPVYPQGACDIYCRECLVFKAADFFGHPCHSPDWATSAGFTFVPQRSEDWVPQVHADFDVVWQR